MNLRLVGTVGLTCFLLLTGCVSSSPAGAPVAGATGNGGAPAAPASASSCAPSGARVSFDTVKAEPVLTGATTLVLTGDGARLSQTAVPDRPMRLTVDAERIDEALTAWLVGQAARTHRFAEAGAVSAPLSRVDPLLADLRPADSRRAGRYVGYVGATGIRLPFTVTCADGTTRVGTLLAWDGSTVGSSTAT